MPSGRSGEGSRDRFLWVRADLPSGYQDRNALITAAEENEAELILVRSEDISKVGEIAAPLAVLEAMEDGVCTISSQKSPARSALVTIESGEDQERAMGLLESLENLVVECRDWTVIPLENLVAACQRTGCSLIASVESVEEAETALGVLQKGVDGILLSPPGTGDIVSLGSMLDRDEGLLDMVSAEVVSRKGVGSGDRACVDTCSMLEHGEGMLIGSQADGLVLVHGETIETEYVESRPFRVNAGAVHSYTLHLEGKTRYLSDLRSGDEVLLVSTDGRTRVATVGRIKIETRPLVMIELRSGDHSFRVILQDAETIRLVRPDGTPVSVSDLHPGDEVLAHISARARHFGMEIEEKVIER